MHRLEVVYTYGQLRVGDGKFTEFMENKLKEHDILYCRFVYSFDMVPRLPYDDKDHWYKHFGKCLYYDLTCDLSRLIYDPSHYHGKVVPVLPKKNYFSLVLVGARMVGALYGLVESFVMSMNMIMCALYELMRSFIIQYTKGSYHKEGWLSCSSRVIRLIVSGVSDYSSQDYVYCTCLVSPEEMLDSSTLSDMCSLEITITSCLLYYVSSSSK
ncbi:hypothetical protein GQ457_10G001840 [Hibiscus cannabinus]